MNAEQIKILSERVVSEVFAQIFATEGDASVEGVAVISWPRKLSQEELSRQIDAAITLSTEKLRTINSGS